MEEVLNYQDSRAGCNVTKLKTTWLGSKKKNSMMTLRASEVLSKDGRTLLEGHPSQKYPINQAFMVQWVDRSDSCVKSIWLELKRLSGLRRQKLNSLGWTPGTMSGEKQGIAYLLLILLLWRSMVVSASCYGNAAMERLLRTEEGWTQPNKEKPCLWVHTTSNWCWRFTLGSLWVIMCRLMTPKCILTHSLEGLWMND